MADKNYISKINTAEDKEYYVKDTEAREAINNLKGTSTDTKDSVTIAGAKAYSDALMSWGTM